MAENVAESIGLERFALYGLEIEIRDNFRIEVNPKSNRNKGDVAFHSPRGNRFFVSWGNLDEATKRFKTLEQHRDSNIRRIKKGQDVREVKVGDSYDAHVLGHRALFTRVTAEVKQGMFGRATYTREMWSMHLYCQESGRYYVVYCLLRDPSEYEDYGQIFGAMAKSLICH